MVELEEGDGDGADCVEDVVWGCGSLKLGTGGAAGDCEICDEVI